MKIQIISLFPEMFSPILNSSMLHKAQQIGAVTYEVIDLRQFGNGPRKTVDDTPYGGGDGMLLRVDCLKRALDYATAKNDGPSTAILPTPRGHLFQQSDAIELAEQATDLIFICPRYEGYDERITQWVDRQYCLGNFVVTGGELPVMLMIDAVTRLLPNVLGGKDSAQIQSFYEDNTAVEFPQYTRPETFEAVRVPEVLLSGNHGAIAAWRKSNSHKAD